MHKNRWKSSNKPEQQISNRMQFLDETSLVNYTAQQQKQLVNHYEFACKG